MGTLKDEAEKYESKQTKNIADLDKVLTDLEVYIGSGTDDKGKQFEYRYIKLNDMEYRVPVTVLKDLKVILKENPNLTYFKVKKTGSGFDTNYTVIPLS